MKKNKNKNKKTKKARLFPRLKNSLETNRTMIFTGIFTLSFLTLPALRISESCIQIKIGLIFFFTLLCGTLKGFMKALFKAFINLFEAPQRSVKLKIRLIFSSSGIGT